MQLQKLRYFVTLVEKNSFTEAARDCYITQSALSQQIKKLEQELEVSLYTKKGRSFQLTPAGKLLYHKAKLLLSQIETITMQLQRVQRNIGKTFRLGLLSSMDKEQLPEKLKEEVLNSTGLELDLIYGSHDELFDLFSNGSINAFISTSDRLMASDSYSKIELFATKLYVEVPPTLATNILTFYHHKETKVNADAPLDLSKIVGSAGSIGAEANITSNLNVAGSEITSESVLDLSTIGGNVEGDADLAAVGSGVIAGTVTDSADIDMSAAHQLQLPCEVLFDRDFPLYSDLKLYIVCESERYYDEARYVTDELLGGSSDIDGSNSSICTMLSVDSVAEGRKVVAPKDNSMLLVDHSLMYGDQSFHNKLERYELTRNGQPIVRQLCCYAKQNIGAAELSDICNAIIELGQVTGEHLTDRLLTSDVIITSNTPNTATTTSRAGYAKAQIPL